MIWGGGGITATGRCGLHFVPPKETINAAKYLQIIQEKVPQFMFLKNTTILQQDGAPCHSAKSVKDWIASSTFELLNGWPGNSPDLNPIENCWVKVKSLVAQHNCSSRDELIEAVKRVWCQEIDEEYCRNLVNSMPRRIAACLANKGLCTKY